MKREFEKRHYQEDEGGYYQILCTLDLSRKVELFIGRYHMNQELRQHFPALEMTGSLTEDMGILRHVLQTEAAKKNSNGLQNGSRKESGTETKTDPIFFSKTSSGIAVDLPLQVLFFKRKYMCLKKFKQFFLFVPTHY